MNSRLLLGHRGARAVKSIPENTLASFDRALADGCDGFEFDLRLTADGAPVICHDPRVGRLEIARAKAQQVPDLLQLATVLDRYRIAFLDIELKVPGLEAMVADRLRDRAREKFVVSSFLPGVLSESHQADTTLPLGLICETKTQLRGWKELPVQFLIPSSRITDQPLIEEVHDAGRKVVVWTVNSTLGMKRFADWGVDGIITDKTSLLCRTLSGKAISGSGGNPE
jgi:glycerophosphoryl diester phosphodiesterase